MIKIHNKEPGLIKNEYIGYNKRIMQVSGRRKQKMQTVTLQDLSKTYSGGKEAVKGISLSLEQGEVFGFLGPNGAGKTTTVKLLNGMLAPTSGKCSVMGSDPAREPEKVHAVSGVLTEHARMYDNMTGLQNLVFYAAIFGIPEQEGKKRALSFLEKLELKDAAHQRLAAYSTGMRQRLSLARALIHHPGVLFLDEPTSGLDPESAQNVNRLIQKLAEEEKTTVFLCTHQLRYAQEICTRYGLIDEGRLLAAGTLGELREKSWTRGRTADPGRKYTRGDETAGSCGRTYPAEGKKIREGDRYRSVRTGISGKYTAYKNPVRGRDPRNCEKHRRSGRGYL